MAGSPPLEPRKQPYVKTFSCPNCAASITVRGGANTLSAVCDSCKSIIDVTDANFRIIQEAQEKASIPPLIPLGQRGKLNDIEWEVIGFMRRRDVASGYRWDEYLLFSPYYGYRWLTQADGHWNLITMIKDRPLRTERWMQETGGATIEHRDFTYKIFHKGEAVVSYVMGEFYWRVKVGDIAHVEDYICPPYVLSREVDYEKNEESWSLGDYVEPDAVKTAFNVEDEFPDRSGIAPNQPVAADKTFGNILKVWCVFVGIILMVQCYNIIAPRMMPEDDSMVYSEAFHYDGKEATQPIVSKPFELKHGTSNVHMLVHAPVNNAWLSLDTELVNDKTGETFSFSPTVEKYSGYSEGEYWVEGGQDKGVTLSSVPDGTYHLAMQPSGSTEQNFSVVLTRRVTNWGNFIWSLVFLTIFPLLSFFTRRNVEMERWSQSSFSPYGSSGDDDDD